MINGQLVTCDEAVAVKRQHKTPCSDCPWRRESLAGWLGGVSAEVWLADAHGEARIDCHTRVPMQCAGAATYRANVGKSPRSKSLLILARNTKAVFSWPLEFMKHHKRGSK